MNIEYEKRLIDLLGYSIEGPDNSNRWKIFDSEHKSVGFIQFKKLYNKNIKKGYPATYGYRTEISSDKISFRYSRKAYDKDSKFFSQNDDNHYSFELICPNQEKNDIIELNFGEYPSINIWSKKYGYLIFNIDYNGLYLNFKSETENYDIRELLIYNAVDELEKAYSYQISYSNKNVLPGKKKTRTREISGYSNRYYHDIGVKNF